MQPSPVLGTSHPPVIVAMCDDHVVISCSAQLDLASTEALIDVAGSAIRSGAIVMLDLDPSTPSDDLIAHGPVFSQHGADFDDDNGSVHLIGPGCVRLATTDAHWTIDLAHSRLLRSEKPIDLHFVDVDRWTPIRALWLTCQMATALTAAGTYLTCHLVWATGDRTSAAS